MIRKCYEEKDAFLFPKITRKCVHFSWIIYGLPQEITNRQQCTFHTTSTAQCQNLCFLGRSNSAGHPNVIRRSTNFMTAFCIWDICGQSFFILENDRGVRCSVGGIGTVVILSILYF